MIIDMAKTDIQSVTGMQIGGNAYALLNVGFSQLEKKPYIQYITRSAPLYAMPNEVLDDEFMHLTRQWQNSRADRDKAIIHYEQGLANLYGNYADIPGFTGNEEAEGIAFTTYYETLGYHIHATKISPVMARVDKEIPFDKINTPKGRKQDIRLVTLGKFLTAQHLDLQPFLDDDRMSEMGEKVTASFADTNYRSLLEQAAAMTQQAAGQICLKNNIEAVLRINPRKAPHGYNKPLSYESTDGVSARGLQAEQFKTFLNVNEKMAALMNSSALRHFHETGDNLFAPPQARRLAELQHARHAVKVDFSSAT